VFFAVDLLRVELVVKPAEQAGGFERAVATEGERLNVVELNEAL
jgi:hypothetical protein